ncbi:putative RTA1 domain protein [Colletotrichum cereale]|nr:putative RTA1 domain protein [Colletotrichum cereale]
MTALYNLPGSTFFLVVYAAAALPQVYFGIRYKTWGFLVAMTLGLALEIIAYVARVRLHHGQDVYRQYIVTITIGPAFFSAALYLSLARIIPVFGASNSRLQPRTYTIVFMLCDFVALVLQAAGGGLVAGSDPLDQDTFDAGLGVLRAGLAFHVAGMLAFVLLASDYTWSVWKNRSNTSKDVDRVFLQLRCTKRFRVFIVVLAISTLCIFIRTCYRLAELSMGLDSDLANDEVAFLVLEGAIVAIAVVALSIFHPGVSFQGLWARADFRLINRRPQRVDSDKVISGDIQLVPNQTREHNEVLLLR